MQIEAHDPHHRPEADLQDKGLSHNAVGLFGGTVLGISSVAPAYALTATIGILRPSGHFSASRSRPLADRASG